MLSSDIARRIDVSAPETAKILQLLVWGGFVTSRRGTKGGFHLARKAEEITIKEVIDFFMARHPVEPESDSTIMRVFDELMAPCQQAFERLSIGEVAIQPKTRQGHRGATQQLSAGS